MIQFVRPWLLIGVLGALVPLVIHLAGRRKAPRVQFTALRFVLSRDPARARAARLRERLLLGLRMVIAALIAVALAKPMVPSLTPQATAVAGSAPVALVIVADDSLSMATRDAGGPTRLALVKARAKELLAHLPLGSAAAVVASGYPARPLHTALMTELGEVRADVRALRVSARSDDAERAVALARQLLAGTAIADRRIVVLSDLERTSWAPLAPGGGPGGGPPPPRAGATGGGGAPTQRRGCVGARASGPGPWPAARARHRQAPQRWPRDVRRPRDRARGRPGAEALVGAARRPYHRAQLRAAGRRRHRGRQRARR